MQHNLTEFSHGAGCGCKLSPGVLADILGNENGESRFTQLLVGNETKDDAAVVDLDGETAIVSTTDFFMPIVDNAHDFGAIAATNAISDIYAMGATPMVAIAILGWPIDKLPASVASEVLEGGREVCSSAGIPLAGGHSIDAPEPIFGLAVTGKVPIVDIKRNNKAKAGDHLYLTKPLGIGLVTTAQKRKVADSDDLAAAKATMLKLNKIGKELSSLPYVSALTDVTGFGLAGHLLELCDGSNLAAELNFEAIPIFDFVQKYIDLGCIPGGTERNWKTYGDRIKLREPQQYKVLADPQTSGGLLICISADHRQEFESFLGLHSFDLQPIGALMAGEGQPEIMVN